MKKDELLYQYSYDAYIQQLNRKTEIRNRSSFFIGLGIPIVASIASASLSTDTFISCLQATMLVITGCLTVISLIFFLLIFIPSKQYSYLPSQLIGDISHLEIDETNKGYLDSFSNKDDKSEAKDYLAYRFFSNTYSDLFDLYNKTHEKFKIYFILQSIAQTLSFILIVISLIV